MYNISTQVFMTSTVYLPTSPNPFPLLFLLYAGCANTKAIKLNAITYENSHNNITLIATNLYLIKSTLNSESYSRGRGAISRNVELPSCKLHAFLIAW